MAPSAKPAIQPVLAILYLHMEGWVKKYFPSSPSDEKQGLQHGQQGDKK